MKYEFDLTDWQINWPLRFWHLPWWNSIPPDEFGPKEIFFGVGPFQARAYLWRRK